MTHEQLAKAKHIQAEIQSLRKIVSLDHRELNLHLENANRVITYPIDEQNADFILSVIKKDAELKLQDLEKQFEEL